MATLIYPDAIKLQQIAQTLMPTLMEGRRIFDLMPIVNEDDYILGWEQQDNYLGLQQVRGLDGQPSRVKRVGVSRYLMEPGAYGEFLVIDERELTRRRQMPPVGAAVQFDQTIDITDLVMQQQEHLLKRRLDRIEYIGWTLLQSGTFAVANGAGVTLHTDSYTPQTFVAETKWTDYANATPLADLRACKLKHRGYSVNFGASATLFVNQVTANAMLMNTNDQDLYGRRKEGLATLNSIADLNRLLAGDDLPQVEIYDQGYRDDANAFHPWLADGVGVLVGQRPGGQIVADYAMARNANNPNFAPGPYIRVIDRGSPEGGNQVPRSIEVHDGHNGGPRIYYPSAIIALSNLT